MKKWILINEWFVRICECMDTYILLIFKISSILKEICAQYTLIKKEIKLSSYIRKFRRIGCKVIWLTASSYMVKYLRISSNSRKPSSIWFCIQSHLKFLIDEENFGFFINAQLGKSISNIKIKNVSLCVNSAVRFTPNRNSNRLEDCFRVFERSNH